MHLLMLRKLCGFFSSWHKCQTWFCWQKLLSETDISKICQYLENLCDWGKTLSFPFITPASSLPFNHAIVLQKMNSFNQCTLIPVQYNLCKYDLSCQVPLAQFCVVEKECKPGPLSFSFTACVQVLSDEFGKDLEAETNIPESKAKITGWTVANQHQADWHQVRPPPSPPCTPTPHVQIWLLKEELF